MNPSAEEVVNLDDLSDNDLITTVMPGIAKRLWSRKGKFVDISPMKRYEIKKLSARVPDAPLDNISFHSVDSVEQWKYVYQRRIALERELGKYAFECHEIMEMISYAGLMKTITRFAKCYEDIVKEFIVNIPVDCADLEEESLGKFMLEVDVLNSHLLSSIDIWKKVKMNKVNTWPVKDKLPASKLSVKYAILHRIGAANWVPTNNSSVISVSLGKFIYAVGSKKAFDYGAYIFYQTVKHADTCAVKMHISFPTLICCTILNQHPWILLSTDVISKRESVLSLHFKLFTRKHVLNIAMTSTYVDNKTSTKAEMIFELVEVCKELDEAINVISTRKLKFEKMIKDLKKVDSVGEEVGYEVRNSDDEEGSSDAAGTAGLEDS
ncbi:uncharacterized protein LOC131613622 [Vicia villosa]|uniref:uncharacterized protein LOC131613622 n=1 Tax=Vicia villosa TaxID=3911 RepID=UPI00273BBB51|nr:uncharacterized protein LOC131613622 [Vicia villosa]